jgi:cAMP-dependent protein kinase regulator
MAQSTFPGGGNPFSANTGRGLGNVGEESEAADFIASSTGPFSGGSSYSFGGASVSQPPPAPSSGFPGSGLPSEYNTARRTSVSAESLNPTSEGDDNWKPPFHQKTSDQVNRLRQSVSSNFLFSHLEEEQANLVLGALVENNIPAKGIKVITQGDAGDYFYIVEKGTFDIYVNSSGTIGPGPEGMGTKVNSIGPGGSFGELALMYNAPRAATVISTEASSTLWRLDRVTFRRILMDSAFQRRRMYESFLEEVPLLQSLTPYERSKIADALNAQRYKAGDVIIREGDPGEDFFLLESGQAEAYKNEAGPHPVKQYHKGDYFGELALLDNKPRAASVVAKTDVKVAVVGKDGFQRLLGPVEGIMRRIDYAKVEQTRQD